MKLVKLTAPNGAAIFVNPEMITAVADDVDGSGHTVVFHEGGQPLHVTETKERVEQLLSGQT